MTVTVVLKPGTLIDGTGREPQKDMALIIEGDTIREVRPAASLPALGDDVQVYDCPGMFALPGIIDCHDHLAHLGHDMKERFNTPASLAVLKTARWARETLLAGLTTMRDAAGVDLGVKMAIDQGVIDGPRLFISLVIISQTGGHGDLTQPSGQTSEFPVLPGIPDGLADGPDECRKKVREVIRLGADWVKVATTGGVGSPRGGPATRQLSLEELQAIVDEAHAAGKPVFAHAHGGQGLKICIEARVDSIEHAALADEQDLQDMARLGIWLVPTLSVTQRMFERLKKNPGSLPAYTAAKLPIVYDQQRANFRRALELGIKIAMGTDAGAMGHAENLKELPYMVEAGMTPMQSIVASTAMCGRLLGMPDRLGTLLPGRLADVILTDTDPLKDIWALADAAQVKFVMKDGRVYKSWK
jgi:imidazolonepropionase-like amidohydrolase